MLLAAAGATTSFVARTTLLRRPPARRAARWLSVRAAEGAEPESKAMEALRACGRRGRWKNALELLAQLEASGDPLPVGAWHSALAACRKRERKRDALELLQRMGAAADTMAYNEVLHTLRLSTDYEAAKDVWRSVEEKDASSYYHLLVICGETGRWAEALQLLAEMEAAGLEAGVGHYKTALRACSRDRAWEAARGLLRRVPAPLWAEDSSLARNGLKASAEAADSAVAPCWP